jgi:hypothetical protein
MIVLHGVGHGFHHAILHESLSDREFGEPEITVSRLCFREEWKGLLGPKMEETHDRGLLKPMMGSLSTFVELISVERLTELLSNTLCQV